MLLEKGELLTAGEPKAIIAAYHKLLFSPVSKIESVIQEIQKNIIQDADLDIRTGNGQAIVEPKQKAYYIDGMRSKSTVIYESKGAIISEPCISTLEGERVNVLCKGEVYNYTFNVVFQQDCQRVRFGMLIKNITGIEIGGFATSTLQNTIETVQSGSKYNVSFAFPCRLNPGVYFLNAGVKGVEGNEETYLHRILDALMIRVMPESEQQATGIVDFEIEPRVQML